MTRKDYIAIADKLRMALEHFEPDERVNGRAAILFATIGIADTMAADNPRFDRERFLAVVRGEAKAAHKRRS